MWGEQNHTRDQRGQLVLACQSKHGVIHDNWDLNDVSLDLEPRHRRAPALRPLGKAMLPPVGPEPLEQNRGRLYPGCMEPSPSPDAARPDRRGAFLLLFFCLLAVGAGNTMLTSAVLPPLTRELKLPDWTAGAIFSLSAAIWVITAPYWGAKSNSWGRRKVAAIGMFGFAASMFFFALSRSSMSIMWIMRVEAPSSTISA